jgi:hypothetical protein
MSIKGLFGPNRYRSFFERVSGLSPYESLSLGLLSEAKSVARMKSLFNQPVPQYENPQIEGKVAEIGEVIDLDIYTERNKPAIVSVEDIVSPTTNEVANSTNLEENDELFESVLERIEKNEEYAKEEALRDYIKLEKFEDFDIDDKRPQFVLVRRENGELVASYGNSADFKSMRNKIIKELKAQVPNKERLAGKYITWKNIHDSGPISFKDENNNREYFIPVNKDTMSSEVFYGLTHVSHEDFSTDLFNDYRKHLSDKVSEGLEETMNDYKLSDKEKEEYRRIFSV